MLYMGIMLAYEAKHHRPPLQDAIFLLFLALCERHKDPNRLYWEA